jgi:hypothetical protein
VGALSVTICAHNVTLLYFLNYDRKRNSTPYKPADITTFIHSWAVVKLHHIWGVLNTTVQAWLRLQPVCELAGEPAPRSLSFGMIAGIVSSEVLVVPLSIWIV